MNAGRALEGEPSRSTFCPLDLLSSKALDSVRVAENLLQSEPVHSKNIPRFAQWLRRTAILQDLRDLQFSLDRTGVLNADIEDEKFRVAMTLRDCTVFVRFPEDPDRDEWDIEARIGDLDVKSKGKEAYWKRVERQLIDEGWYEGNESAESSQPLVCSIFGRE